MTVGLMAGCLLASLVSVLVAWDAAAEARRAADRAEAALEERLGRLSESEGGLPKGKAKGKGGRKC